MKRVWWVAKIAVLMAASYCIFAPGGSYTLRSVLADGCDTSQVCARNRNNNCYCTIVTIGGPGCTGCFVPNNDTGCGTCSGGPSGGGGGGGLGPYTPPGGN
jgi:hypothetical protein